MSQIRPIALWAAAILLVGVVFSHSAEATFIVNVDEVGSNVVATGGGTIDLTGLALTGHGTAIPTVVPVLGIIVLGTGSVDVYSGVFTGLSSFGGGGVTDASATSGDPVGFVAILSELAVPSGYKSGDPLSDTATWDNATFASLGLTPGTYVFSWGPATGDDTFVVNIGVVPEPSTLAVLVAGLLGLGLLRRRKAS